MESIDLSLKEITRLRSLAYNLSINPNESPALVRIVKSRRSGSTFNAIMKQLEIDLANVSSRKGLEEVASKLKTNLNFKRMGEILSIALSHTKKV